MKYNLEQSYFSDFAWMFLYVVTAFFNLQIK